MRTACGINGALRAHLRKKAAERLLLTIRRLRFTYSLFLLLAVLFGTAKFPVPVSTGIILFFRPSQQIISRYIVVVTQKRDITDRHRILSALVSGIYSLVDIQIIRNFSLLHIVIFPQTAHNRYIIQHLQHTLLPIFTRPGTSLVYHIPKVRIAFSTEL